MFEKASRLKLRFSTTKGNLTVEDLWDLSLSQLDNIYKSLNKRLKEMDEESLLDIKSNEDTILELQVAIIKHVVTVKLAEKEALRDLSLKKIKKQKILELISQKENEEQSSKSIEELKKELELLD